jgi:geranylgeranyl diphosphate synthase type I
MNPLIPNTSTPAADRLEEEMRRLILARGLEHWNAADLILSGSYFRGSLLIELAEALEVDPQVALSVGVVVEVIHNASLVHDDIIDEDLERRGRPSSFALLGASQAMLLGDALIANAYDCLANLELPSRLKVRLIRVLSKVILNASRGQASQLDCKAGMSCTLDACIEWSRLKTGMLFALPVELALILADREYSGKLAVSVGVELGLAYQIMDDLYDWLGCKRGRADTSDLRNAEWTFARIAERDSPGYVAETMLGWIVECMERVKSMNAVLPPEIGFIFNQIEHGIRIQTDEALRYRKKSNKQ